MQCTKRGKRILKVKIIVIVALIIFAMIAGIAMLVFGIGGTIDVSEETKNYEETEGKLVNYRIYSQDEDGTTYRLIYSYVVDGHEYIVTTDVGTGVLPEKYSTRTVRYNPQSPAEAMIPGNNKDFFLIVMGIMFVFVPLIILLAMLHTMGYLPNLFNMFFDIGIGLLLMVISLGVIYMITGEISPIKMFQSYDPSYTVPLFIPILLFAAGTFQVVKTIVLRIKNRNKAGIKRK